MLVLWLVQRRTGNAAIVDVGWTAGVGALGVLYALAGDGLALRRVLVGGMVGLWSARLASHLWFDRIRGKPEEGRYLRLRELWGARTQSRLLLFFLGQALLAVLLSLAFLPGTQDGRALDGFDAAALALWVLALAGESLADRQLARFKADERNAGRVMDRGLWSWSRHPNYFFEWLLWIAFVLPGLAAPWGGLTLLAPAAMLYFVVKVTGIPPSEAQALRSRGDAYRAYQQRVSPFLPLPPRKEATS
jgi:steroid 5-alpha reductase family enzyme